MVRAKGGEWRASEPIGAGCENLIEIVALKLAERVKSGVTLDLPAVDGFPLGAVEGSFAGMNEEVEPRGVNGVHRVGRVNGVRSVLIVRG